MLLDVLIWLAIITMVELNLVLGVLFFFVLIHALSRMKEQRTLQRMMLAGLNDD